MSIDTKRGLITIFMVQHAGFPGDGNKSHGAFVQAANEHFGQKAGGVAGAGAKTFCLMAVSLRDIRAARKRIADGVVRTPCLHSIPISEITGARVFCKLESHQRTGSFKERGARNALLQLDAGQRQRGVVAASAGNHASALAYHGQLLGIPVTVVLPEAAPLIKISTCQRLGARVILAGADFGEARSRADAVAAEEGLCYINGYDDPAVIAGQGTIGLEILEQVPEVESIVVPVGGGGLIAGIATAVKALRPRRRRIIGVESTHTWASAARCGRGIRCERIRSRPWPMGLRSRKLAPMLLRWRKIGWTGSCAFPKISSPWPSCGFWNLKRMWWRGRPRPRSPPCFPGSCRNLVAAPVVLVLAGGDGIDPLILSSGDRKRARGGWAAVSFHGDDQRPARWVGAADQGHRGGRGENITEIVHERAFSGPDVSKVNAVCTAETPVMRRISGRCCGCSSAKGWWWSAGGEAEGGRLSATAAAAAAVSAGWAASGRGIPAADRAEPARDDAADRFACFGMHGEGVVFHAVLNLEAADRLRWIEGFVDVRGHPENGP